MDCVFTFDQNVSATSTVLPQRNLATCCMTINLSRLTLDDGDGLEKFEASMALHTDTVSSEEIALNNDFPNDALIVDDGCELEKVQKSVESNDSKENEALSASTVLKEKAVEEPAPKRKKHTHAAE